MKQLKNIHIGTIIKEKVEERKMSVAAFARKIHCDRTTIYDIYKRKSIDTELLIKISYALDYDFIHRVYFHKKDNEFSKKLFVEIEVDDDILQKLNFPQNIITLKYAKSV
ncbi:MAG: helix-turn-helix transcriptional regulator [Prevotellaceae bacterium]|jgi:transcriptional regulator with XRE-family HTH domain|nr:helix-turn-helix transcriptional regulator [Prevotellaceae bacterium]